MRASGATEAAAAIELEPATAPRREQLVGSHRPVGTERRVLRRAGVAERCHQFPAMRLERVRVGHRQRRRRIEVGQVADLVGDRPTRARCRRQPLLAPPARRRRRRGRPARQPDRRPESSETSIERTVPAGWVRCACDRRDDRTTPPADRRAAGVPARQGRQAGRAGARHHERDQARVQRESRRAARPDRGRGRRRRPRDQPLSRPSRHGRARGDRRQARRRRRSGDDRNRVVGPAPAVRAGRTSTPTTRCSTRGGRSRPIRSSPISPAASR